MIAEIVRITKSRYSSSGEHRNVIRRCDPADPIVEEAKRSAGYEVRLVDYPTYDVGLGFTYRYAEKYFCDNPEFGIQPDPVHDALKAVLCVPTKRYLWVPADMIEFTPALAPRVYGDGRALLGLTTIHSRPRFYVIRIDSSWEVGSDMSSPDDVPELWSFLEDIQNGLEEDFGSGRPDPDDEDPEIVENGEAWPAFDDQDGCIWWRKDWPDIPGFEFEPHPYSWQGNLLKVAAA